MKLRTNKVSTLGVPVTIAVLLAATAGGTYWVVIRPHSIQAHCNAFATEASQHPPTSHVIFVKQMENTNYTSEYQECLRQHGL